MSFPASFLRRLRALFQRDQLDREMDEEMRFHLEMQARENAEAGVPTDEATHLARQQFGHVDNVKEKIRERRGFVWLESIVGDMRFALRSLRKRPGFTIVVVLMLALGMGASTAVFTVVNSLLLRPLPLPDADELYTIKFYSKEDGSEQPPWYPFFQAFRQESRLFSSIAGFSPAPFTLDEGGKRQSVFGEIVTHDYFSILGVQPSRGRFFTPEEDLVPGRNPVVVISHSFWQSHFGGSEEALGATIALKFVVTKPDIAFQQLTVVGIAPVGFEGVNRSGSPNFWVTTATGHALGRRNTATPMSSLGRLAPGTTQHQATAELDAISKRLPELLTRNGFSDRVENYGFEVRTILESAALGGWSPFRQDRQRVSFLAGLFTASVILVVCLSCANAATLLLTRTLNRRREIAVRLALGAGRWRLVRQVAIESLVIAMLGAFVGLVIAKWGIDGLLFLRGEAFQYYVAINNLSTSPDARVIAFALTISFATAFLLAWAPAWQAMRFDLYAALNETPKGNVKRRHLDLRSLLIALQVAVCLILLVGAGLCLRSFAKLAAVDPGFKLDVLNVRIQIDLANHSLNEIGPIAVELVERLQAKPGIQSVALSGVNPLGGGMGFMSTRDDEFYENAFRIEAYVKQPDELVTWSSAHVGPGFFRTLGIPVMLGREFTPRETSNKEKLVIVNERFVRRYWPDQNPLGKHLRNDLEVIGVVRDSHLTKVWESPEPTIFLPGTSGNMFSLLIETEGQPEAIVPMVREELRALDENLEPRSVETLGDARTRSFGAQRMLMTVLAAFAGIAAFMALIGLYGLMAYTVAQRTREIGIRVAVGAQHRDVIVLILRRGLGFTLAGIVLGLVAALGLTRFLESLLYDLSPTDPLTYALIAVGFMGVATLACSLPARHAAQIDPAITLRAE